MNIGIVWNFPAESGGIRRTPYPVSSRHHDHALSRPRRLFSPAPTGRLRKISSQPGAPVEILPFRMPSTPPSLKSV